MKKALIIAGGVIAVLVVAALVIPSFLNWNQYKVQIENAIEAATGRDVSIDGDIALTILPAPAFSVEKLSLANAPGGKVAHMVTLDALNVRIHLLPLLRGNVDVDKIVLVAPRINLEVLSDGRRNWDFAGEEKGSTKKEGGGIAADVRVNQFVIEDGEVIYRDDTTGTLEKIESLNAVISAETLDGPYKVKGDLVARATPLAFALSVGKTGNGKIPVSLDATFSGGSADAAFRGLVDLNEPRSAEGTFKVHATDVGALAETVSRAVTGKATSVPIHQPIKFESAFVADETSFHTTAMTFGIGSSNADGHIAVNWEGASQFDIALAFGTLDADELLTEAGQSKPQPAAKAAAFALPDPATLLPGDISGKLVLSAEALRYRKRVMRQVQLTAQADKRRLDIDQLHALLPGGAEVKLAGHVANTAQGARFDGKIDASANNLRGLLDWLEVTPEGLEPGRLSSFAVDGGVYLTKAEAGVTKALVRLDTANFKGDAAFRPGTPPVIRVNGALDRLDLDYYLPKGAKCLGSSKEGKKPDPLAAVNGDVVLTIGRLTCPETRIDGLVVDASISKGVLTLRKFSADRAAGLKLAASGRIQDLATTPRFQLALDAGGQSLGEVERLFPGTLPKPADQLGAVGFSGKIAGTPLKLEAEGTLDLGGTTLAGHADVAFEESDKKANAKASGIKTLNTDFTLKAASLAQFIEQWDLPLTPPPTKDDRPLEVGGTLSGSMAAMNVNLKGRIATAGFAAKGTMRNVDTKPTYDLALDLNGKDLTAFVRGLGIDFEPADPKLGPVKMNAALSGGQNRLRSRSPPVRPARWSSMARRQ